MKIGVRLTVFLAAILLVIAVPCAKALTLMQERLIDMDNRFAVVVSDFEPDGLLTRGSVSSLLEQQLTLSGLEIIPVGSPPPLALINVNIVKAEGAKGGEYDYLVDMNIYNMATVNTKYQLRQGTVWSIGAYRITPGKNFPRGVEGRIRRMLRLFIGDYYTANPGLFLQ